ncbi:MAG TPA: hypothetical protein VGX25_17350 [Actinophytocola sp.]|uniref:hypothetical protein n=1 Tax=Actinophytocola sp. TaxID=1872138 RepID=UPI002DDC90DA|nr:hypothetical protein [Actinophytocola sp.]HEV2781154.1 hypothetical protein [Actinophytocola sp.]
MDVDGKKVGERSPSSVADRSWSDRLEVAQRAIGALDKTIRNNWRRSRDRHVQAACKDARLVMEFVVSSAEIDGAISAAVRQDEAFVDAFEKIGPAAQSCVVRLLAIGDEGADDKLIKELAGSANDLRQRLDEAVTAYIAAVSRKKAGDNHDLAAEYDNALDAAEHIQNRIRSRRLVHEGPEETPRVRDRSREANGNAAANRLSQHYSSYAEQETTRADRLRVIAGGLLAVIAGGVVGLNALLGDVSIGTELVRLSAVIPIAALAGYLMRESSRHRSSARWASELAIALRTLPGYTRPLDNATAVELRRVLGMRVFGPAGDRSVTSEGEGLYDDLAKAPYTLEEIGRKVLEIVEKRKKSE